VALRDGSRHAEQFVRNLRHSGHRQSNADDHSARAIDPLSFKRCSARGAQRSQRSTARCGKWQSVSSACVKIETRQAYAEKTDKEKKRAARAKTKGIKALNAFIARLHIKKSTLRQQTLKGYLQFLVIVAAPQGPNL
jgi:hypothetical protein